jgi:hypothetical protein
MTRRLRSLLLGGDRLFVTFRALSVTTALLFALVYSKHLGVQSRGLLTFIMSTNLVFSIILISGISLHLRNIVRTSDVESVLGTYLLAIFTFSLLTPFLNYIVLIGYQNLFNLQIPNNLIFTSVLYCFFSTLSFGMHDSLLLLKSIRIASILDLSVVIIQILCYLTLVYSGETSYFVSVLISISISYLVMVVSTFTLIVYSFNARINFSLTSFRKLISDSSTPTFVSLVSQLIERVDKVFLGVQMGVTDLGRFSTNQSIVGIIRFLPDAYTKLSMARDKNFLRNNLSAVKALVIIVFLVFALSRIATLFTGSFLGEEWMLPWTMIFAVTSVEILRGFQSLLVVNVIRANAYAYLRRIAVFQSSIGIFIQPFAIHYFGIWGSILTSFVILLVGLGFLRRFINA